MKFKDLIKEDIDIFINDLEFAEEMTIDDKKYIGVLTYRDEKNKQVYEGLMIGSDLVVSLKYDEVLFNRYRAGKSLKLNGYLYIVNNIESRDGLLTIYLIKNEGV